MKTSDSDDYDIMSPMDDEIYFPQWLRAKMNEREWGNSDLARAAKIDRQLVSNYLTDKRRNPDVRILEKIAKALEIPPEEIYQAAGIPLSKQSVDPVTAATIYLMRDLDTSKKNEILEYVKLQRRLSKKGKDD